MQSPPRNFGAATRCLAKGWVSRSIPALTAALIGGAAALAESNPSNPFSYCRDQLPNRQFFSDCFNREAEIVTQRWRQSREMINTLRNYISNLGWWAHLDQSASKYLAANCDETKWGRQEQEEILLRLRPLRDAPQRAYDIWGTAHYEMQQHTTFKLAGFGILLPYIEHARREREEAEAAVKAVNTWLNVIGKIEVEDKCGSPSDGASGQACTSECTFCPNGGRVTGIGGDGKQYTFGFAGQSKMCAEDIEFNGRPFVRIKRNDQDLQGWSPLGWRVSRESCRVECNR